MAIQGDLRTLPFPDLLNVIYARRLTGILSLSRMSVHKRVVFAEGDLLSATSNDPRETLPQSLIRLGLANSEQIVEAMLKQEKEGTRLGVILVSSCVIDAEGFERALRLNAEEAMLELFLWSDGTFHFAEEEIDRRAFLDLGIHTRYLLTEGLRRRNLWEKVGRRLSESDVVFRALQPPDPTQPSQAHKVFELASQGRTLPEIAAELRVPDFDVALFLNHLCTYGCLEVDHEAVPRSPTSTVDRIRARLAEAEKHIADGLFDDAEAAYQEILRLDPVSLNARKGQVAVAEARKRQRLHERLPLSATLAPLRSATEMLSEDLDPQEGFVMSRIVGKTSVSAVLQLCPMPEDEVLLILYRLIDHGVVALKTRDQAESADGHSCPPETVPAERV